MEPEKTSTVAKTSQTPYQLDITQTTTACKVLLKTIAKESKQLESESTKPNLLANKDESDDDEKPEEVDTPIWLILTTKKHIITHKRLKPSKIALPHPINNDQPYTICLITADPQETYSTLVKHPSFPPTLRSRITRVVSLINLKKNYKSFESRRKLLAEHDIFLADDRIVTYLPKVLGKTFYKGGSKRPVPVDIAAARERDEDGERVKIDPASGRKIESDKVQGGKGAASPERAAKEIERALKSALVHLAPGTSTAVKVARAAFTSDMVSENVQAVVKEMAEKMVSKGWRNIRAIHVKGPNTMAFPIWLASELWVDEKDVLEEKRRVGTKKEKNATKKLDQATESTTLAEGTGKRAKRKADDTAKPDAAKHVKKKSKAEDEKSLQQERLKKQKAKAFAESL